MNIFDAYIARMVVLYTGLVLIVLMSLFAFVDLVKELGYVGKGNYTVITVFEYLFWIMPRRVYELFPIAALVGSIVGLGMLANTSELTAFRAAGISNFRFVLSVLKVGIFLILLVVVVGEYLAPNGEQQAQTVRSQALTGGKTLVTKNGIWTRDGSYFINIESVATDNRLTGVQIYRYNDLQLVSSLYARRGVYVQGNVWQLEDVSISTISETEIKTEFLPTFQWTTQIAPEMVTSVEVKPERLSIFELYFYIRFLSDNAQDAYHYELNFWKKLVYAVNVILLMSIAVPFVMGSLRSSGIGNRILSGVFIGIGFFLFEQTVSHFGLIYHTNPFLTAIFPSACFFVICIYMFKRVF